MSISDDAAITEFVDVADHYLANWGALVSKEMEWSGSRPKSITECIDRACLSEIPSGRGKGLKRHSHQTRLNREVLAQAKNCLLQCEALVLACKTFDELYDLVERSIGAIPGAGPLLVYDVAHRIGTFQKLAPEEVYLHTGTRLGAKAIGLSVRRTAIPVSEFPIGLQKLNAAQLEDVLCVYRQVLARIHSGVQFTKIGNLRRC